MATTTVASHVFKVVVAGSFATGKSTLIRQISDTEVVGTEAPTSGVEAAVKDTTTVGMEYGTLTVGEGPEAVELSLFGVPGQERFHFLWDIVAEGADAFLLLVDATRPETWGETVAMGDRLSRYQGPPLLIGVNRAGADPHRYQQVVDEVTVSGAQHIPCEVVDPDSVREALVTLLLLVLDRLEAEALPPPPALVLVPSPPPEPFEGTDQ